MGSMTRTARGQRFIAAFGADLPHKLAPPGLGARCTMALDAYEEVRLFTTVQDVFGHSHDVMFDSLDTAFDPETDYSTDPGALRRLAGVLELTEPEVEAKLRAADLWDDWNLPGDVVAKPPQ